LNQKEVDTIQNKFDKQVGDMQRTVDKDLDKVINGLLSHQGPGKEKALVMVNEAYDDLLKRKLKILMSKQFSDLTKYLGTMQSQVAMEHMIRTRQI